MKQKRIEAPIIRSGYFPGAIGRITELHARYYHEHWGFGLFFESKVASDMAKFFSRFEAQRDGIWTAVAKNRIIGSIVIDGMQADSQGAHLRWFILSPDYHGQGIGRHLLMEALAFCRRAKFERVYLWTFSGLDAGRHLYEGCGFCLVKEHTGGYWGKPVTEQKFELNL